MRKLATPAVAFIATVIVSPLAEAQRITQRDALERGEWLDYAGTSLCSGSD